MNSISIIPLKSLNGIPFFTKKDEVRKYLGMNFENSIELRNRNKEVFNSKEIKALEDTIKALYKEMGKNPNSFEWQDISEFVEDSDTYPLFQIGYEDDKFVTVTIYKNNIKHITIMNHDCSDFELEKIMTLATDFKWDRINTSWVSISKQISLFCPENKREIDNITFACSGYYNDLEE